MTKPSKLKSEPALSYTFNAATNVKHKGEIGEAGERAI
jgi:hypothetical protein